MPKTFTDQTATVTGTPLNNSNLNNLLTSADIGVASGAAGLDSSTNLIVPSGHKIVAPGQTANTSGSNVANQAAGTFSIPIGTANATNITVPNTLVTSHSVIFLSLTAPVDLVTAVRVVPGGYVAGTSFQVDVFTSGATGVAVSCHYLIVN